MTLAHLAAYRKRHPTLVGSIVPEVYRNRMDELFERVYGRSRRLGAVTWWARLTNRHVVTISKWRHGRKPLPDYQLIILNLLCALEEVGGPEAVRKYACRYDETIEGAHWRRHRHSPRRTRPRRIG